MGERRAGCTQNGACLRLRLVLGWRRCLAAPEAAGERRLGEAGEAGGARGERDREQHGEDARDARGGGGGGGERARRAAPRRRGRGLHESGGGVREEHLGIHRGRATARPRGYFVEE